MQIDPMADERTWLNPYNYVQNNPLILVDPAGTLDDYYGIVNDELVFLGSDGQGSEIRLVTEGREDEVKSNLNGTSTTDDQRTTVRSEDNSTVVTFNESNIESEFQGAHDRTKSRGLENSVVITLDPATATVDAQPGAEGSATKVTNTFNTYGGSDGLWTQDGSKLVLGVGHGHPTVTQKGKKNTPGFSADDAKTAAGTTIMNYAIDSYAAGVGKAANIHQVKPGKRRGTNKIGTTQNAKDLGRKSFLGTSK